MRWVMLQVFGCTIFSPVHLREYAVVIGSLVATLTELYEPFGINDNVAGQGGKLDILESRYLVLPFSE